MSSQTPTWEVVEEAIENVRKALNEQAECLTAQAATLDSLAVQVKKCRDGHQTTESEQCPIDCMNQIANLLNQRMNKMDQGFSEINTKMLATEFNNIARVQNSHLEHPKDSLASFHNAITNQPIPHFLGTVEDLYAMDSAEIGSLLGELGESPATNVPDGQEKLRKILGLRHIIVWQDVDEGFDLGLWLLLK